LVPRRVPQWVAFFDELENAGFVEGKKLIVDWRFIGFVLEQTAALLGEPVERPPDVLVPGAAGLAVAKAATRGRHDRERAGPLVRPTGCNLTGVSIMATQLDGKRLEILTELVPASRHIAAFADPISTERPQLEALRSVAASRAVALRSIRSTVRGDRGSSRRSAGRRRDRTQHAGVVPSLPQS